jgi:hypothetical protein
MPRADPQRLREWRENSKQLERHTPIKKKNDKRAAAKYEKNYGVRADKVRAMHCLVVPLHALDQRITCRGRIVAAHAVPRKMGGCGGDRRKLVNLCAGHHDEAGEYAPPDRYEGSARQVFELRWGVDLLVHAAMLAARFDAMGLP